MFNDNNDYGFDLSASITPNRKRKRTENTSASQYALYLEHLENDEVFRTGVLNPRLPPDYLEQAWKDLASKLNSDSKGPALTPAEWKKRFADWKNATRKKYRNVIANLKGTGGGPPLPPEGLLTVVEEKALSLWGRVAVTGSTKVAVTGGLQLECKGEAQNTQNTSDQEMLSPTLGIQRDGQTPELTPRIQGGGQMRCPTPRIQGCEQMPGPSGTSSGINRGFKRQRESGRPLNVVGDELLNLIKKRDNSSNRDLEERRLQLEELKLRFEVAKYKFENPGFEFDC